MASRDPLDSRLAMVRLRILAAQTARVEYPRRVEELESTVRALQARRETLLRELSEADATIERYSREEEALLEEARRVRSGVGGPRVMPRIERAERLKEEMRRLLSELREGGMTEEQVAELLSGPAKGARQ